jgi:glycolate oxidase
LTGAAITPAALEMLDGWTLRAVEAGTKAGYPTDSAAVLLIELEGLHERVEEDATAAEAICRRVGAREVRRAKDEAERQRLWSGRKNAFGAVGRISPSYYVQDGVIPRTKIPQTLAFIENVSRKYGLQIGNIFHAGDGNLHPLILFDNRSPEQTQATIAAGREILEYCVSVGGSITGEHGVGMEKMDMMDVLFTAHDLEVMGRLKNVFNPQSRLNPQKVLPATRMCRETVMPGHPSVGPEVVS